MAQINDLKDLLKHEILDLYSTEEQIIEALPKMIEKAANADLKKALSDHLKVTGLQKSRLDEIKQLMGEEEEATGEKKGFFSKLFGGAGGEKCKGTEGLIREGNKMMREDMTEEVMDAAIIGAAQKIEHYEISGYGTAAAYARELGLHNVAGLLKQTLEEEYAADDSLTKLAVGKLNTEAENPTLPAPSKSSSVKESKSKPFSGKSNPSKSSSPKSTSPKSAPTKNVGAPKKGVKAASKSGSKTPAKSGSRPQISPAKKSAAKKAAPKRSTSPGNRSGAGSVSKTASKKVGENVSGGNSKSGKSKLSKRR